MDKTARVHSSSSDEIITLPSLSSLFRRFLVLVFLFFGDGSGVSLDFSISMMLEGMLAFPYWFTSKSFATLTSFLLPLPEFFLEPLMLLNPRLARRDDRFGAGLPLIEGLNAIAVSECIF